MDAATGRSSAQATFTNETASGWQQADFSTPVAVKPDTTYVAAYLAPNGHYSDDLAGPAARAVDNPPLHAPGDAARRGNGVYAYGSQPSFPTNTYNATNYWVDVVFTTAGAAATHRPTSRRPPTSAAANVTWTAPSGGSPVTTYTVTPYIGSTAQASTTVTGSPPATNARIHNLTGGTSYTFKVTASNPNGARAGLGAVQRGHADVGRRCPRRR